MTVVAPTALVCFVVCHGGPADHFTYFADSLKGKGYQVQIYASGPALTKMQGRSDVTPFSLEEEAVTVAKKCREASIVITDVGHPFDVPLQTALSEHAPKVFRLAYYDNPEPYVPGGYSAVAAKVMSAAQGVLFANANLATAILYEKESEEAPIPMEKRGGLGFYPLHQAETIAQKRASDRDRVRAEFFSQHRLTDRGQTILVYMGGNNEEYFERAFPAFLGFLGDLDQEGGLSDFLVVLQQHPGAKKENRDGKLLSDRPEILISTFSSEDAQVLADQILYYQTSMGPLFALAGGRQPIQVGHKRYDDILVRNGLCVVANSSEELKKALEPSEPIERAGSDALIRKGLGICSDWQDRLEKIVRERSLAGKVEKKPTHLYFLCAIGALVVMYLAVRFFRRFYVVNG